MVAEEGRAVSWLQPSDVCRVWGCPQGQSKGQYRGQDRPHPTHNVSRPLCPTATTQGPLQQRLILPKCQGREVWTPESRQGPLGAPSSGQDASCLWPLPVSGVSKHSSTADILILQNSVCCSKCWITNIFLKSRIVSPEDAPRRKSGTSLSRTQLSVPPKSWGDSSSPPRVYGGWRASPQHGHVGRSRGSPAKVGTRPRSRVSLPSEGISAVPLGPSQFTLW